MKIETSNYYKGMKCTICGSTKHLYEDCPKYVENFDDRLTRVAPEGEFKPTKLFDDQLIECAKNNYNKGRLSALKDELKFLIKTQTGFKICGRCYLENKHIEKEMIERLSQIQKEIKEIEK